MADGQPPRNPGARAGEDGAPALRPAAAEGAPASEPPPEPPSLDAIRVKAARSRGLNKPAILAAAGGATALVLVLASGALSGDRSRLPTDARPMMSDPARPEMARGAVRDLPASYDQTAGRQALAAPAPFPFADIPVLGPPLPGDVAAFAPDAVRGDMQDAPPVWMSSSPPASRSGSAWRPASMSYESDGHAASSFNEPAAEEADLARRSGLFFALQQTTQSPHAATGAAQPPARAPLFALAPAADQSTDVATGAGGDRSFHPGAVIAASLITAIDSEAPGPVIAQVTQAVHDSATGRTLLIPQGARLIGEYRSSARYGQSRVAITWSRLIMPDGREIALDEAALDPSGAAGLKGKVDNHWGEVFGAAALGTLISIGAAATVEPQLTYGGIGVVSRDLVDAAIADGVQRGASIVTNRAVDRSLAIPPTIRAEAGRRITVIVTRRVQF